MRQLIICKSFWKCKAHIGNYMYYNLISYKCGLLIIVFIKENQKTKRKCIWTFYTKNIFYSISLTFRDELGEKSSILLRLDFFLITKSQWNGMAHALMYIKTWAYCVHEIVLRMKLLIPKGSHYKYPLINPIIFLSSTIKYALSKQ